MGRTFSKQGSSSTNWDVVGRELATLDELSKMPKGYCILFISTVGAFYSKLYNLKDHPNYLELYEPWLGNKEKLYDHKKELQYEKDIDYKILCDSGLEFTIPIEKSEIKEVDKSEIEDLKQIGIIKFQDLIIKDN